MKKRMTSILTLIILLTTLMPFKAIAADTITLEDIHNKRPGDQITIKGTTNLGEVTVKVLRPNKTVLYVNVLTGSPFEDNFTLPEDTPEGKYTLIVGQGDIIDTKEFNVTKETIEPTLTMIRLDQTKYTLKIGQTKQLQVIAAYSDGSEQDITDKAQYKTSDSSVATVTDKGIITAKTVGETIITATYQGKTATCEVKVTKKTSSGGGSNKTEQTEEKEPEPTPSKKTFNDITDYPWAKEAIETLASQGIIKGTTENTFEPGKNITRADFITLLVRALNLKTDIDTNFDDIEPGTYYYEPLGIAKKLGIAQGIGYNKFNPQAQISRQDMMVIVARALKTTNKISTTGTFEDISTFADAGEVSSYAIEGVATLIKEGIIQGSTGNMINPKGNATRAETAVIIYRIYTKYNLATSSEQA
ncbi:Ig domain protein group 2 domain protein [Tepidanaerobacter acetatoxydans Re1]|uniref:Ig domain protein group 2 domain protein n=1 Tax=Tepidanaerobacter acetatoxydans (strain DSM 21804 / JCM 16047 / Re1) TaxID=1209989 RepID=F4LWN6_TEPAE|nr:S-layer homology domain-containing protein [Tepidanaerobacter acetatoxydans]AEE90938.1 Ig domain protein group 2 domain protein [Tepidanaerobacter acetatoxydans Re1]CDI40489.1 Ig domain protein group 2 domain protein [Tepidanaerobacter acetatoxydans Re1]